MVATPQRKMLILKSGDGTISKADGAISKAGGRNLKSKRPQFKQIISHFLRCDLTCHCGRRIPTIAAIKNQEDEVPATRLTSRPLHHLCNRRLKGGQITKDRIGLTFSTFNLLAADSCPKKSRLHLFTFLSGTSQSATKCLNSLRKLYQKLCLSPPIYCGRIVQGL